MKLGRISLILLGIFVVSTAIAIATGPVVLFNGFEPTNVYQTANISMQGVNKLSVDISDPNLNVHPISGNEFRATLSGTYAKNQYDYNINLSVEKIGNSVMIKVISIY